MTDEPAPAVPAEPDPALERARVEPSRSRGKWDLLPLLYLLGFLVLAGTLVYLWQNPPPAPLTAQDAGRMDSLQTQLAALRDEVGQLRSRPAPPAGASEAEVKALQQQVSALANRPAPGADALAQLTQQVQALASRQPDDLGPLQARLQALEARPAFDPAAIDRRLAEITGQVQEARADLQKLQTQTQELGSRNADATGKLGQSVEQLGHRVDGLEKQQTAIAQRAQLAARLQGAAAALAAGQRLGDIPGAPPALARFAKEPPPTEAALRQSFEHYAAAAAAASQPALTENQGFGSRLWTRAQQAVTVRQGDRVLVGDPITGVLSHARELLDAGDLAGAIGALKGLAGPAAEAMKPWVDSAQSLVDARAAIANLAAS